MGCHPRVMLLRKQRLLPRLSMPTPPLLLPHGLRSVRRSNKHRRKLSNKVNPLRLTQPEQRERLSCRLPCFQRVVSIDFKRPYNSSALATRALMPRRRLGALFVVCVLVLPLCLYLLLRLNEPTRSTTASHNV